MGRRASNRIVASTVVCSNQAGTFADVIWTSVNGGYSIAATLSPGRTPDDSRPRPAESRRAAHRPGEPVHSVAWDPRAGPCAESRSTGRSAARRRSARPVDVSMVIDEPHHHVTRRSSSASAKYADALRKSSFVGFSSRFSRSNSLNRWRSSVVSPPRWPWSRSAYAWRIQNEEISNSPCTGLIASPPQSGPYNHATFGPHARHAPRTV